MCDPLVLRVLTPPLQLGSNLFVTSEGTLMVLMTCLTCYFLCAHHRPASRHGKKSAPIVESRDGGYAYGDLIIAM